MYAWRSLQGKSIVAAFLNLRAEQADQAKKIASKKTSPTKAIPPKLHSV